MSSDLPRITFGMIVLNGQPFIRYNLRALYAFAHQIIVVEGAVPAAAGTATANGHSLDGSLDELYRFQEEEDPQDKVEIVARDGLWNEKDEMSQAYAQRATGDYLWQVDVDEFYQPEDMQQVLHMLADDPQITAASFPQITFWGGLQYVVDGWYLRQGAVNCHRVFKWGPYYKYVTHRPPTVHDPSGRDLRQIDWLRAGYLARKHIYLYHYSLMFPQQVIEKSAYYGVAEWAARPGAQHWADQVFLQLRNPYRVHNVYQYPSWLEEFKGQHPPQIQQLWRDIEGGKVGVSLRDTADIERLLSSPSYKIGRGLLKLMTPAAVAFARARRRLR